MKYNNINYIPVYEDSPKTNSDALRMVSAELS
jgi:hypothetical protein